MAATRAWMHGIPAAAADARTPATGSERERRDSDRGEPDMTLVDTEASYQAEPGTGGRWLTGISGVAWIVIALIVLQFDVDSAATIGYLIGGFLIVMGVSEFVLLGSKLG